MNPAKNILNIIAAPHTLGQKTNYLRYLFSKKEEVLKYNPVTISIVATTRCTLACNMCPTHSRIVPKDYPYVQKAIRDIDFEMFKDIVNRFKKATTVHIIGSGEPLLNKDFFKMVDYAASRKMKVKTFSNGTTIGDLKKEILSSKLDGITISINGHNAEEFTRMTGMDKTVYQTIYDGVRALVEEKNKCNSSVKIKLSFIIDRYNYTAIPEMVKVGLELDADHIFFCNFLPAPFEGLRAEERVLTARPEIRDALTEIFRRYPPAIRKRLTPPVIVDAATRHNLCDIHFTQIRFDGDGNVSSCSMMLLNMSGNGTYKDDGLWNNDFFRDMRRAFISGEGRFIPEPCKSCPDNRGKDI